MNLTDEEHEEIRQVRKRRILELYEQGKTMREIEREVFGYMGGVAHVRVQQVISEAKGVSDAN